MAKRLRLAANISHLFTELDLPDRIKAAADAGFDGVEILSPYDHPAPDLRDKAVWAGLPIVLINCPPPNYTGGEPGYAAIPALAERFRRDFARVQRYAQVLGAGIVHVMSGVAEGPEARQTLIGNLRWACAQAPKLRISLEPLNRQDFPGYFLNDYNLARDIVAEVEAPNLIVQFDAYHAQMLTGDALGVWKAVSDIAGHVQLGDAPGRGAPGSGDIDFPSLIAAIRDSGYSGWVSAEYAPGPDTSKTLDWMPLVAG